MQVPPRAAQDAGACAQVHCVPGARRLRPTSTQKAVHESASHHEQSWVSPPHLHVGFRLSPGAPVALLALALGTSQHPSVRNLARLSRNIRADTTSPLSRFGTTCRDSPWKSQRRHKGEMSGWVPSLRWPGKGHSANYGPDPAQSSQPVGCLLWASWSRRTDLGVSGRAMAGPDALYQAPTLSRASISPLERLGGLKAH